MATYMSTDERYACSHGGSLRQLGRGGGVRAAAPSCRGVRGVLQCRGPGQGAGRGGARGQEAGAMHAAVCTAV
jgi:hypothetical protein